jgi:hypothetical protein
MIKGIAGKPWVNLSELADFSGFYNLHPNICKSFAITKEQVPHGILDAPKEYLNSKIYDNQFKQLSQAYSEFLNLPDNNPIKINGKDLKGNELVTYLKFALGGYDLYSFYVLCDFKDGWRTSSDIITKNPLADYFPEVMLWINSLVEQKVFSHIGRATFFVQEAGGISFEHFDPSVDPEHPEVTSEFVYLRQTLERPFYIRDPETLEKFYVNSKAAYWNDQDYHGGDPVLIPSYALRIDGIFSSEFRERMTNEL